MDEKALYEQIGRLSIALAEEQQKVNDCCRVIHQIKTGEVSLDQLVTTPTSFSLTPTPVDRLLEQP